MSSFADFVEVEGIRVVPGSYRSSLIIREDDAFDLETNKKLPSVFGVDLRDIDNFPIITYLDDSEGGERIKEEIVYLDDIEDVRTRLLGNYTLPDGSVSYEVGFYRLKYGQMPNTVYVYFWSDCVDFLIHKDDTEKFAQLDWMEVDRVGRAAADGVQAY